MPPTGNIDFEKRVGSKGGSSSASASPEVESSAPSLAAMWLIALCTFIVAFAIRAWFGLADGHSQIVFACDASEYLRDASGLEQLLGQPSAFWFDCVKLLTGQLPASGVAEVRQTLSCVSELKQAGPVFPIFLSASYLLVGMPVSASNWAVPVIAQSLLTSATCALVSIIGSHAWNRRVGLTAGILAAFYPGFIVNSARMYSESFSTFLLCLVVALLIPLLGRPEKFRPILTGVSLAALQLSRSVMVLVTGLSLVIASFVSLRRRQLAPLVGTLAGLILMMAPWMVFQELCFGKSSFVVDRVGNYNLFIGTHTPSLGWLSYPYPDGRGIEKKKLPTLLLESARENPSKFFRLLLDKPVRLFKFHWNDFRTRIGPFDFHSQVIYHQALLVLAAIGFCLTCASGFRRAVSGRACDTGGARRGESGLFADSESSVDQSASRGIRSDLASLYRRRLANSAWLASESGRLKLLILVLLAMHAIYILFITVPRYNLTAIPFLILFAAAGCVGVSGGLSDFGVKLGSQAVGKKSAISAALLVLASVLLVVAVGDTQSFVPFILQLFTGLTADAAMVLDCMVRASAISLLFLAVYFFLARSGIERSTSSAVTIITLLAVLPFYSLPLRAHGRWYEWEAPLASRASIRQTIDLPAEAEAEIGKRSFYALIDCSDWQVMGGELRLSVNGEPLSGSALPLSPFVQNLTDGKPMGGVRYLECEYIFDALMRASERTNADLRQWYVAPIPKAVLEESVANHHGRLELCLSPANDESVGSVYGAYARGRKSAVSIPSISLLSWEKAFYGVENQYGLTDSRYDLRLSSSMSEPSLVSNSGKSDLSSMPGRQTGQYNLRILAAPIKPSSFSPGGTEINGSLEPKKLASFEKFDSYRAGAAGALGVFLRTFPEFRHDSLWAVDVALEIEGSGSDRPEPAATLPVEVRVVAASMTDNGKLVKYSSPWVPSKVNQTRRSRNVRFAVPFAPSILPGRLESIRVSARTAEAPVSGSQPIKSISASLLEIPNSPIGLGAEVF